MENENSTKADRLFRDGLFLYHQAEFNRADPLFKQAAEIFLVDGEIARHVETFTYRLRILAEQGSFEEASAIEKHVLRLLASSELPDTLRSRAHYVLGVCNSLQWETIQVAKAHFEEAIKFAMIAKDMRALSFPLYGLAYEAMGRKDFESALKLTEKLDQIFTGIQVPEIQIGCCVLQALIARDRGNYDTALTFTWRAYDLLREHPNFILYVHTIHSLGSIYLRSGDLESARLYLELADRSIRESQLPRLKRMVADTLKLYREKAPKCPFDLRVHSAEDALFDCQNRRIDMGGQFVLRDLLLLFLKRPGQICTKAEITAEVWEQSYDPVIHDNKIYVTVRRLRHLLEPAQTAARQPFLLRGKGGYYFNPKLKVQVVS